LLLGYLINCTYHTNYENTFVLQLAVFSPLWGTTGRNTHGHRELDWIGLDWVSQLVNLVGLDLAKCTHVQLWHEQDLNRQND